MLEKIQETYENFHPKHVLVLLFVRTEVDCWKGLLATAISENVL